MCSIIICATNSSPSSHHSPSAVQEYSLLTSSNGSHSSALTFHAKEVRYGLDLLLRPVQHLLVHVRAQVSRVRVAAHQMVHVGSGHIEAPAIGAVGGEHGISGQIN